MTTPVQVQRWGWYSIGVNVVLAGISLAVAATSGSLAVGAELVHNLVDLASAGVVLVGVKLATRRSRRFPYGLYKVENVVAVVIALLIFFTAYELARHALLSPDHVVEASAWMIAGLAAAVVIALAFGQLELRAGRRAGSPALIADAREYRVHVLTTSVALASVAAGWLRLDIDRVAALLIVAVVVKIGWDLLVEAMRVLLDASLGDEILEQIRGAAAEVDGVAGVRRVTGRNAGRIRFVEIDAVLHTDELAEADAVAHRVERRVREAVPNVERVMVRAHPLPCDVPPDAPSGGAGQG